MANTYDFDIGILGAGAAGLTVAAGAAQLGAKTLLVEKEKELGGDCLHYGCVPSKTLIKTAHVYHLIKNAHKFGLPRVEPLPVNFRDVAGRIRSVIGRIQKHDSEERFCNLGVRVEFGESSFKDEHTVELNGKRYSAKNWVLSTGSSPAVPPFSGLDRTPYLTNREIFSLDTLPVSMIVLGAGPIAVEMAQAFRRLGAQVHVVQRSGQILSKEDKDMADVVMNVLAEEGVIFHLNADVAHIADLGYAREVEIESKDGKKETLRAETILVAMGRRSNIEGLGLDTIGVEFDNKGIKVDNRLRTSQKHIYAAGDVIGAYQFTHAAGYEGGIIVTNAVFHLPRKTDYTFLPWCTYAKPELASIGLNEKTAQKAGIEYSVYTEAFSDNDRSLAEGSDLGKAKLLLDSSEKPIGVQLLGLHAGELVNEWVAVTNGKTKLSTLAGAVHPYPTLGEINKRLAANYFSGKIFSDKVKKALKFLFHFKGRACGTDRP